MIDWTPNHDTQGDSAYVFSREKPVEIVQHPTDLPTNHRDIPDGPIEGWVAYCPSVDRGKAIIIGPFVPVVARPYNDGVPCISLVTTNRERTEYHFRDGKPSPLWYQSGLTLRFVRK